MHACISICTVSVPVKSPVTTKSQQIKNCKKYCFNIDAWFNLKDGKFSESHRSERNYLKH